MKGCTENHCWAEIVLGYLEGISVFNPCKRFLQETRCCFALFCSPLRWDSDAMLEYRFHPAWHFGQSLLRTLEMFRTGFWFEPHCSDMSSEWVWKEVWFSASPYTQRSMEVGKYSPKTPQRYQINAATDLSLSWTLRHWKQCVKQL